MLYFGHISNYKDHACYQSMMDFCAVNSKRDSDDLLDIIGFQENRNLAGWLL